jgi:hypothetical protein
VSTNAFLDRVLARVPRGGDGVKEYSFMHWPLAGKATEEAVGLLPVAGVDPLKLIARVLDVDHYVGPIPHVAESRAIDDARFARPKQVRFYQRVKIPLLGDVQQEIVLEDFGEMNGWSVAAWRMLDAETAALSKKDGVRCSYNDGAWFAAPGIVGYALSSAPSRDDVGMIKWKMLTAGADAAAPKVIKDTIAAMAKWAAG